MTDPVSVLLIMGAAVVGPIEARSLPVAQLDGMAVSRCWDNGRERVCEVETLPELCERVMREIGAEHRPTGVAQWYLPVGREVYCIPTPAGYRR